MFRYKRIGHLIKTPSLKKNAIHNEKTAETFWKKFLKNSILHKYYGKMKNSLNRVKRLIIIVASKPIYCCMLLLRLKFLI